MTEVSVPRNKFDNKPKTSRTGHATYVRNLLGWQKDHFSDTNRNWPQHLVEINSLVNGTRMLMFAIEIKNKVLIRLIILESSITEEGVLFKGFMSRKGLCLEH